MMTVRRLLLLGLGILMTMAKVAASQPRLRGRSLVGPTLTTTNCNAIRLEDYQAELQLVYKYLVEFAAGGSRSLHGLQQAITHAVAQELDSCDILDRPLYKIKTTTQHAFSKVGKLWCYGHDRLLRYYFTLTFVSSLKISVPLSLTEILAM
jgi:hypothetical protein